MGSSDLDAHTFHPSPRSWPSALTLIAFQAAITEIADNVPCFGRCMNACIDDAVEANNRTAGPDTKKRPLAHEPRGLFPLVLDLPNFLLIKPGEK